jgi:hypothetical protein
MIPQKNPVKNLASPELDQIERKLPAVSTTIGAEKQTRILTLGKGGAENPLITG